MALQVTLIKSPDDVQGGQENPSVHTFDERGGTLGRGSSNTWALPDPDRFLSSCHCEILCEQSKFYLVDLSTNGTFINGSPEPLGKGMRTLLADGDTFAIGDYLFSVSLGEQEANNPGISAIASLVDNDPFGAGRIIEPIGEFAPAFAPAAPAAPADDPLGLSPGLENNDPLVALDQAYSRHQDVGLGADPFVPLIGGQRDPLAEMAEVDPTPSMDQALTWPDAAQQNIIPDDWEDDLMGDLGPPSITPLSTPDTKTEPEVVPVAPDNVDALEVPGNLVAPAPNHKAQVVPEQYRAPEMREPNRREPHPKALQTPTVPHVSDGSSDDDFIIALGLDPSALTAEDRVAISHMGGKLLREVIDGLMQLLRSRSTIKNEFRMNVTTIEPFENNPFKFSIGVDDALENIFLKKGKAYKEPVEALRESFQELGEHQLAMIAGVRVGFEKMMDRFDPNLLEKLFKRRGKHSTIHGVRQARCWINYCDYYAGFSDNMDSSFQNLFGSDFVQAYEEHLRKLSTSRKNPINREKE